MDEPKPVYVLHGTDAFLRDAARREIVAALVGDADPRLCVSSFDAGAELADVFDELRTPPLLAGRRVVVLADADAFVSAHREKLEDLLQAPPARSSLVLVVASWRAGTRLDKLVRQIGGTRDCSRPDRQGAQRFIQDAARRRGKKIAPAAASALGELIGPDLARLDAEVEKLATYAGPRQTITAEDVGRLVAPAAGPEAFALANAVTAGEPRAALKALADVLTSRGAEFQVLGMLGWHLRRSLAAAQDLAAGRKPTLNAPPAQRDALLAMLRRRPLRRLQRDVRRLLAADLAMKSGADPAEQMQRLVVELCT